MSKSHKRTDLGIFNSRSPMQEYQAELKRAASPAGQNWLASPVTLGDLESWARLIEWKYSRAIKAGNEIVIRTYEECLTALADYANDLKAVQG